MSRTDECTNPAEDTTGTWLRDPETGAPYEWVPGSPSPGRHPSASAMQELGLKLGVFYYCARELAAGRPCPVKLTDAQLAYVSHWLAPRDVNATDRCPR